MNPKIAIDALLADNEKTISEYRLYPITLGRYALLEAVGSPLVEKDAKFTMLNILPTLYICLNDIAVLKKYNSSNAEQLRQDAMTWAEDNLKTADVPELVNTILEDLLQINKAAPVPGDEDDGKTQKKQEAAAG